MAIDWLWWAELDTIAFGTEFTGGSGAVHVTAGVPLVAAQLTLSGVTIGDTTGFAWPGFTAFGDANGIPLPILPSPLTGQGPATFSAKKPTFFEFDFDCQNAAALAVFTAFGFE